MFHGKYETCQFVAGAALTDLYKCVDVAGTISADKSAVLGVLVSKAGASGDYATAAISGIVKVWAGGAITAGNALTVTTSGWMTVAGSNGVPVGRALATAASGDLFPAMVNFANASVAT